VDPECNSQTGPPNSARNWCAAATRSPSTTTATSGSLPSSTLPDSPTLQQSFRLQGGKPAPLPYTLYDMANDAVSLLDALGIRKAHVVGVSMGGMIAQIAASNHPEHTLSLTSIMATDGKPGLKIIANPERMAKIPRLRPTMTKILYRRHGQVMAGDRKSDIL